MKEHMANTRRGKGASAVSKHHSTHHLGTTPRYRSKIVAVHSKNLDRLACEALHVEKGFSKYKLLMNQKGEWGKMKLPRLIVDSGQEM